MRQTGAGENRQLLTTDQGIQTVDGRDAGLDKLVGIVPGSRVHGQAVDIPMGLSQDGRAVIDGFTHAGEDAAQHIAGHGQIQRTAQEANLRLAQVDTGGGLEELDNCLVAVDLQHLAAADLAVGQLNLAQFVVSDAGDAPDDHQRAGDFLDCTIFFNHQSASPSPTIVAIWPSMSTASCL